MDGRRARWGDAWSRFFTGFSEGSPDECWVWKRSVDGSGYGQVKDVGVVRKAHRMSYEYYVGEIPEDLCVLHNCPGGDNPSCVNPNHLWLGTKLDNSRDMVSKGRDRFKEGKGAITPLKGEENPMSILTEEMVRWIRKVCIPRHPQFGHSALARTLGVAQATITRVVRRELWAHVD